MARRAIYYAQLTNETMNGTQSYRVRFSYGIFSVAVKATRGGAYHYAIKRHRGRLFKIYIGAAGKIERHHVQSACVGLLHKIGEATGVMFPD